MSRTVTVNGNKVTFDTNVELPAKAKSNGREKSEFRQTLEALKPGESWFVPLPAQQMKAKQPTMGTVKKATGHTFSYRKEKGGHRIFCVAPAKVVGRSKSRILETA